MRKIIPLAVLILAGCEANNNPAQPAPPVQPVVSGGVAIGSSGVHPYGGVGLYRGPVSVFIGF